ncbi:MAG: bifunctional diaminohydroxyphosphoribosylaminopyrimidine deaminase/5-amino-6-(5-phosphoribosylamino)uracil reductase RibD [Luteitalea sp.]|nr:bifunctional diaminohydroxyphosphoribosylaminopyrimidine deaminase/5-amino-6-(5-phosphoribosylamino)uracil reductase RibD [Luteitalea sp.]
MPCDGAEGDAVDREFMRVALRIAERGRGRTSPNPLVGAVIVSRAGVVVGSGHHRKAGGPHAEIFALEEAGGRARDATLYCTLEPCCHQGQTGPCAVPIAASGIRRLVIPLEDPDPRVAGRGIQYLRQRGVHVDVGVMRDEAAALNAPFFTSLRERRPHVTMKIAISRDGRIAAAAGRRTSVTGPSALLRVQRLRAEVDAVAIGSETALVDDPLLTVREVYRSRPFVRVVFDTRLRTSPTARLLSTLGSGPVWLITTRACAREETERARALEAAGATLVCLEQRDLRLALGELYARGIQSLLIEGGASLHRACWEAGIVDRVEIHQSTQPLGPGGVAWMMPADFDVERLSGVRRTTVGEDLVIEGTVRRP